MVTTNPEIAEKNGKNRHNINLAEEAKGRGERMAKEDLRSFSNFIEWLIQQEWARREQKSAEANGNRAAAFAPETTET